MKKTILLITILFMATTCFTRNNSCRSLNISTAFDRGSLGAVKIIGDSLVKGQTMHWIKKDKVGNQYYWFYFKVSNAAGKNVRFEFDNMTGIYRNALQEKFDSHTQPVFSNDRTTWQRIKNTEYNDQIKQFSFNHFFEQDSVWIAYAHPYDYNRHKNFIQKIKKEHSVTVETIGKSVLKRDISLVIIPQLENKSKGSKNVLVLASQHAGEDCGAYFIEGLIEKLLSSSSISQRIRKSISFMIVPMVNPDGYFYGTSRYNYNMEDLNTEWDDDINDTANLPVEPEVLAVKNWYKKYKETSKIDLVIDIHSHGQKPRSCVVFSEDNEIEKLVNHINELWPTRFIYKKSNGNSRGFFVNVENIPACTLELSQSDFGDNTPYLTIDDYKNQGANILQAIHRFLQNQ